MILGCTVILFLNFLHSLVKKKLFLIQKSVILWSIVMSIPRLSRGIPAYYTPSGRTKLLLFSYLYLLVKLKKLFLIQKSAILGSIVASIPACHAGDHGSIPRKKNEITFFTYLHFFSLKWKDYFSFKNLLFRLVQWRVSPPVTQDTGVRFPTDENLIPFFRLSLLLR